MSQVNQTGYSEALTGHDILNLDTLAQTGYDKHFKINGMTLLHSTIPCPANPTVGSDCFPDMLYPSIPAGQFVQKQEINYKTIDSLIIHNAPNTTQVQQFEMTTPDRPIDSVRYARFKGIGGDWVDFTFPNLYNVAVYKTGSTNNTLILKTIPEIEQTIRQQLRDHVIQYNAELITQQANKTNYFNAHAGVFNTIATVDPFATPNRSYTLLNTELFNDMISDEMVRMIAQELHLHNSILRKKPVTTTISQELDTIYDLATITNKKSIILNNYITKNEDISPVMRDQYEENGYEAIYVVSDGDDAVTMPSEPSEITAIRRRQQQYQNYISLTTPHLESENPLIAQDECV